VPRPAMRESATPRHSLSLVKLGRTGVHGIVDGLLDSCRIASVAGGRSLKGVAFVIAVVVVSSVDKGARVLV
jgi:hypothetical protein